jgi:hypothetical protein
VFLFKHDWTSVRIELTATPRSAPIVTSCGRSSSALTRIERLCRSSGGPRVRLRTTDHYEQASL